MMVEGYGAGANKTTDKDLIKNIYEPVYNESTSERALLNVDGSTYTVPTGKNFVISYLAGWDNLASGQTPFDLKQKPASGGSYETIFPRFGGGTFSGSNSWHYTVTIVIPADYRIYRKGNQSGRGMTMTCSGLEVTA